jgi:hypothetical protein
MGELAGKPDFDVRIWCIVDSEEQLRDWLEAAIDLLPYPSDVVVSFGPGEVISD